MPRRLARAELAGAVGWMAFGTAVLVAAWRMERLESLSINPWSAPGLMPGVLGALMLFFGAALALRALARVPAPRPGGGVSPARAALAIVLCCVFGAGLLGQGLPFSLTAAGFLFVAFLAFRRLDGETGRARLAASSALIAVAAAVTISLVFEKLFLVRLP